MSTVSWRIPTLGYHYRNSGTRSNWLTFKRTLPAALDLSFRGPVCGMVAEAMRGLGPDVVVSDTEAWTHHVARGLGIPRIDFDHFGILAHCQPRCGGSIGSSAVATFGFIANL